MIILDTDHLTVLGFKDHPQCLSLMERLEKAEETVAITVVSWEEQVRGWLAEVNRARSFHDQIIPYQKLLTLLDFLSHWKILPFDDRAAAECVRLRKEKVRIGSQDLKIAAITLVEKARLLSANLRDFKKVSGLQVENWLVPGK